jgi:hypothetical protein
VEICITLGRMTGSPFSPVHPVPAKWPLSVYKTTCEIPGKSRFVVH